MKNSKLLSIVALLFIMSLTRTVTAQVQYPISAKNVVVCPQTRVQLLAPQGAISYEWQPSADYSNPIVYNPVVTVTEKKTYSVNYVHVVGGNLVKNGDFENGNDGSFVSYYNYKTPAGGTTLHQEGTYTVWKDAQEVHNYWNNVSDHTGNGNFLIANGHTEPNFIVWEQKIQVAPNTDYIFQAYGVNFLDNPAQLQFSINDIQLGNIFTLMGKGVWQQFYQLWNSGANNGFITIRLLNQRTTQGGNDFGVDDISFQKIQKENESIIIDVYAPQESFDTIVICENQLPFQYQGKTYTSGGTFLNTQKSKICTRLDSVAHFTLVVNKSYTRTLSASICEGEHYTSNGFDTDVAGVHTLNLKTVNGCDSIVTLNLTVNPSYTRMLSASICEGERYTSNGFDTDVAGVHTLNLKTVNGCDSTVTLNLTVNPVFKKIIQALICEGETYGLYGFNEKEAGTYVQNLKTVNGCDSIVTLYLTVSKLNYGIDYELLDCKLRLYRFIPKNIGKTNGDKLEWTMSDGTKMAVLYPEVQLKEGDHEVKLKVTSSSGCTETFSANLTVTAYYDDYTLEVTPQIVKRGNSTVRMYTNYKPDVNYEWNFGDGSYGFDYDVVHTYNIKDENYYDVFLSITDSENCTEEKSFRILVDNTVEVPNTFTPNVDGYNDLFMKGWHIKIFDRKGVLIYEGDKGWDGTYYNKLVADDTYFYIMTYTQNGNEVTKKGYITVIK